MEIKNSNIVITGAAGFVGVRLATILISKGARVTQLVRPGSSFSNGVRYFELDLYDHEKVSSAFYLLKPDFVIHLAASKNRVNKKNNFINIYDENVSISSNVINACLDLANLRRFIFIGSCDEYGAIPSPFNESNRERPINAYGLAKLAVTKMLCTLSSLENFPSVILRPTVIYGPRQGGEMFLSALIQSLIAGRDFPMTFGDQFRDFVYVDDVVNAIIAALIADQKIIGEIFNIGFGKSIQVKHVAMLVSESIGNNSANLVNFGAIPYRKNEVMDYSVNIKHARELLDWKPVTSLELGLDETVQYYKSLVQ